MNLQALIDKTLYKETPGIIVPEGAEDLTNIASLGESTGVVNDIYQSGQLPKIKIWFITEKISATSQISSNPTVSGRIQNDNIINDPLSFQFRFKVTDVMGKLSVQDALNALAGTVTGTSGFFSIAGAGTSNSVFQYLMALRATRRPFSVITSFGKVQNVAFESLDFDRDVKTANSLPGNMTLRELFIASQKIYADVEPRPASSSADFASARENKGTQQAGEV